MNHWRHEAAKALLEQAAFYIKQRDEANEAVESLTREADKILKFLNPHAKSVKSVTLNNVTINNVDTSNPHHVGRLAYEFLRERHGSSYSHEELMRGIKYRGPFLASVILRPYIDNDQVLRTGNGRGVQYTVRRPGK